MNYYLFQLFGRAFAYFVDLVFIVFFTYLFCCFIAILSVKRRTKRYTDLKLYVTYFLLGLSGVCLQTAVFFSLNTKGYVVFFYSFLYFSIGLFLFAIIYFTSKKQMEKTEEELLEKFIDEQIEKEDFLLEEPLITRMKVEKEKRLPKEEEIDFSHVKNVMERLSYYELSVCDKRQLRELKETVYIAETEGVTERLREKINDGLGNLLKIMSKHGV